ncbi:MAG TPA: hypothetical protein VHX64_12720 [Caulobacteraceae bacterium]|nr:hypothetical protein [Caulobacteraceae bacterium]
MILDAMVAHPILVDRPIAATPKGGTLSRPPDVVPSLLEKQPASFTKEDGETGCTPPLNSKTWSKPRQRETRQAIDLTGFSWVRGQDLNL